MVILPKTHVHMKSSSTLPVGRLLLFANLTTSLYVCGIFQFETLAGFMFTSGQPANMAPRFLSVRLSSQVSGLVVIRNIYDVFCQIWQVITCKLPDALFKLSRWVSVQLL